MASQINADFEQMLENIHTLVKSIEAAGVGSRDTQIDGLRTNTTAAYIDSASAYTSALEVMIADLSTSAAAFRDALKAVVDQKLESEENLSSTLSQIAQVVDDPTLTPIAQLAAQPQGTPTTTPSTTTTASSGTESGEF